MPKLSQISLHFGHVDLCAQRSCVERPPGVLKVPPHLGHSKDGLCDAETWSWRAGRSSKAPLH